MLFRSVAGRTHAAADALSRLPGVDQGKEDNQEVVLIPETTFIRVMDIDSTDSPETKIVEAQNRCSELMDRWDTSTPILKTWHGPEDNPRQAYMWHHALTHKLIIPPDDILRRQLMEIWHDHPAAGHPGRDETTRQILRYYY